MRTEPVLFVPPMVNKYYLVDLAPERSLVESLVRAGQQVFALSWRNPTEEQRDWTLDTYAAGVLEAVEAITAITGSDRFHLAGNCSGGALVSALAARMAVRGELDRLGSIMLGVTVIDSERAGTASAFMGPEVAKLAVEAVDRRGYLDGAALQSFFAWLRPNDLIWNYVQNNYLLGRTPPAFDILYWNAHTTRMSRRAAARPGRPGGHQRAREAGRDGAARHADRPRRGRRPTPTSSPASPTTSRRGRTATRPRSCSAATRASCSPAAATSPRWSTRPATRRRATASPTTASTRRRPTTWLEDASEHSGTWWTDWAAWLGERSGESKRAPRRVGNRRVPGGSARRRGPTCWSAEPQEAPCPD